VKSNYISILECLGISSSSVLSFQKDFNENIEKQIVESFGNDYNKHLEKTKRFRLKESETKLLWDTLKLSKIGFQENEQLKYMPTLAYWEKTGNLHNTSEPYDHYPIENLIDEYFSVDPDNHLRKILFIISDFGKGKSVFFRNYASRLAKKYLQTGEGEFPVYFNLRNYGKYNSQIHLGIINDFLSSDYRINIEDEYFKKKNYVFIMDSLDESGELTNYHIESVIQSIKKIQQTKERQIYSKNKILISSRPVNVGLESHISNNLPCVITDKSGISNEYYISLSGFTKNQFNEWIYDSISKSADGLNSLKNLNIKIENNDLFKALIESNTLNYSELERPIFAYMIYKLIINNFDFLKVGKIGVYLSFINLLTRSAKHVNDKEYKISLKEEFEFRNILHISAVLWMREKQKGRQGCLKKADICRVLDGYNSNESDSEVLERYKDVKDIQFLSNSYFGEEKDILFFQHQSFAEILLAEYYLKVFIKYSLEEIQRVEDARVKLILGKPTDQTVAFFSELLTLLRNSSMDNGDITLETRKLLFPFLASIGTKKNNPLFSNEIYYEWYKKYGLEYIENSYPEDAITNWAIRNKELNMIVELSEKIINSKTDYLLTKADTRSSLYDNEVIAFPNTSISEIAPDIDKWLALLSGNLLYNNDNELFLNDKNVEFYQLLKMMNNWAHYREYATMQIVNMNPVIFGDSQYLYPEWYNNWFKGIKLGDTGHYSVFLANISHIVRTPFNAILGFMDLLHDKESDTSENEEQFRMVIDENRLKLIFLLKQPFVKVIFDNPNIARNLLDLSPENYEKKSMKILNFLDDEVAKLK
jgi:hypothetical protein